MLEWYILSVVGVSLAFDQHRTVFVARNTNPVFSNFPILFNTPAWFSGGGHYWLWFIGTFTNYLGRQVIFMEYRWISSMGETLIGIAATILLFRLIFS